MKRIVVDGLQADADSAMSGNPTQCFGVAVERHCISAGMRPHSSLNE
jgi:hypothetical protein